MNNPNLLYRADNGFIVKSHPRNESLHFMEPDNQQWFDKVYERYGDDWKYADSIGKLTYYFNDDGFRNDKNLLDIHNEDYIVCLGSSPIEGGGMYYDDTFQQKLSKLADLEVYNMGVAGVSNLEQMNNLMNLLTNYNPPKVVVLFSVLPQLLSTESPLHPGKYVTVGPWVELFKEGMYKMRGKEWTDTAIDYLHTREKIGNHLYEQEIYFKAAENICKMLGVHLIVLDASPPDPMKDRIDSRNTDWVTVDAPYHRGGQEFLDQFSRSFFFDPSISIDEINNKARDLFHAGTWWHDKVAEEIHKII